MKPMKLRFPRAGEKDLVVEGIRKAKESYRPALMIKNSSSREKRRCDNASPLILRCANGL